MTMFEPSIFVEGLILIAVPLIFEMVFVRTLLYLNHVYEQKLKVQENI